MVHIFNSPKKRTKKFDFSTMVPSTIQQYLKSNCFRSVFWGELKTPKRQFEINWPLKMKKKFVTTNLVHLQWTQPRLSYSSKMIQENRRWKEIWIAYLWMNVKDRNNIFLFGLFSSRSKMLPFMNDHLPTNRQPHFLEHFSRFHLIFLVLSSDNCHKDFSKKN